jgi:hypothetical protein
MVEDLNLHLIIYRNKIIWQHQTRSFFHGLDILLIGKDIINAFVLINNIWKK